MNIAFEIEPPAEGTVDVSNTLLKSEGETIHDIDVRNMVPNEQRLFVRPDVDEHIVFALRNYKDGGSEGSRAEVRLSWVGK